MKSLAHAIGVLFQPLLDLVGMLLAFFYSVIPNYAIAIALLTILVMALITPLTVKGTKSMAAMQALAPELKKLQKKYPGAENRQQLNEEMMRLYRENGVSPVSGCLPNLLQIPAIYVLYAVIRGLTNKVNGKGHPRYVGTSTKLYQDLFHSGGKMIAFGMDFSQKLTTHRSNILDYLPFLILVVVAVGLQFIQMRQLSRRNPGMAQANPQAQAMQKYMPLIMAFIYINLAAGANVYFVVSAAIRLLTQEFMFRTGRIPMPTTTTTKPAVSGPSKALPAKSGGQKALPAKASKPAPAQGARKAPVKKAGQAPAAGRPAGANARKAGPNGKPPQAEPKGTAEDVGGTEGSTEEPALEGAQGSGSEQHPRSKSKRPRKAR